MAGIRIEFSQFGHFDYFEIIRSSTSMDGLSDTQLPTPIATNLKTMHHLDATVVEGETYFYIVRVVRDGISLISREIKAKALAADQYWDNVVVLLHFNGVDNGTIFTDETGQVWNPLGGTKTTVDQSALGGSSIFFNGNSSLSSAMSSGFGYGTGDFTWELFVRFNEVDGNRYIIDHSNGSGNGGTVSYYNGSLRYYNPTIGIYSPLYQTQIPLVAHHWYHIAVSRLKGTTTIYIDGIAKASGSDTHNYDNLQLWLGRYAGGGGAFLDGYIDELRITKGVARYTENFIPPTMEFPSS